MEQSICVHMIVFSENGTVDSRPHEYGHPTQYATKMVLRMCDLSRDIATVARAAASCSFRSFVSAVLTFCTCLIFSKSVRSSCYSIIFKRIKMSKSTAKSNSKDKGKQKSGSDESQSKEKPDVFVWTDDEVQLLLKVTLEYKRSKAIENVDWESIQNKYTEILTIFKERLPDSPDEGKKIGKDYPHKPEEITKGKLTSKLKSIGQKYTQAVDKGTRSGHGRVVLLYFDDCEKMWRGCPATD